MQVAFVVGTAPGRLHGRVTSSRPRHVCRPARTRSRRLPPSASQNPPPPVHPTPDPPPPSPSEPLPTAATKTPNPSPSSSGDLFAMGLAGEASLAVVAIVLCKISGLAVVDPWVLPAGVPLAGALVWGTVLVAPMVALNFGLEKLGLKAVEDVKKTTTLFISQTFTGSNSGLLKVALFSLAAGVAEEWLFRGFLLELCARYFDDTASLAISSVLFGLGHFITPLYFLLSVVGGAYFGAIYTSSQHCLVQPAVAHAVYDFVAIAIILNELRDQREADGEMNEVKDD